MSKSEEAALFEQIDEVNDKTLAEIPQDKQKPRMGEYEWTDYVLSHLNEREFRTHKGTKYPTTDGLKRLVYKILGPIMLSESDVTTAGNSDNDFTVTVKHTIQIASSDAPMGVLTYTGVADVNARNLDPPFNKYLTANCSTRALGRACRDALLIQVCVAEELSNVAERSEDLDPDDAGPIEHSQKNAIEMMCRKNGIDVYKLINMGASKHSSLDKVLRGTARKMISVLNGYQSSDKGAPPEILLAK